MIFFAGILVWIRVRKPELWSHEEFFDPFSMSMVISISLTIVTVAVNRKMLSWSTERAPRWAWAIVIINAILLIVLLGLPLRYFGGHLPERLDYGITGFAMAYLAFAGLCNLGAALCCSVVIAGMFVTLGHRVLWPILSRSVYSLAKHGLVTNSKMLGTIGFALLGYAIPFHRLFSHLGVHLPLQK